MPAGRQFKPRRIWPGAPGGETLPKPEATLRSKPLRLASTRRKRDALDFAAIAVRACVVAAMLLLPLLLLTGSAPVQPAPDAKSRFEDWKQTQNALAVRSLPESGYVLGVSD